MAEAALASIAKSALQLFTSLAKDEFLLLWNSNKDLERLEFTIEAITNIHQDTQERGSKEGSVQVCLSRMRNVMYDAEDLFDALAAQILHKRTIVGNGFAKEVRLFFSDANQLGVIFKTAHAVKAIWESVDDIKEDMASYGLIGQQPPVVQPFVRPKTHSFVPDEDVIGRDGDRDHIINMLLPQNEGETSINNKLSVIAIIGFGGLGKTTLAQYVYNHESVKQGFDLQLWACINDLSNLEQVLIEIIASKEEKHSNLGLQKLQEKLRELISGKNFLLVLDDVWDVTSSNWDELERILRCGKIGSKVLVTARSRNVAKCLHASKSCVDLAVLSEESAWSLFVKKAFYSEDELSEHPELEPLGKEIVRRCGKVPLAVIIVGSLLFNTEKDEKTWSGFLDNQLKNTLSLSDDKEYGSIKDILMVSYNYLHPNLKLCFAYCSLFPKDYEFDKDMLVHLWIAQGFIKPFADNEQSLEKEGEEYFFHLVERCFFQEVKQKEKFYGNENYRYGHTAKMHDLLHDVAIDVAKTESAFIDKVSIINKGERGNLRHISISCDLDNSFDYCSLVSDPKTVRTLVIHPWKQFSKDPLNMSLGRFRMLRALHLAQLGIDSISESLGELIHLRYLDLSGNSNLVHLPNSICKLHHLMILVLVRCYLLEDLPPKIEKLVSLRQLYIHRCDQLGSIPSGLRALTSLVKLDRLIVHRHTGGLRYLQDLDNLHGILRIELPREGWLDSTEDAGKASMSGKPKLSGMVIEWSESKDDDDGGHKMPKDEAKAVLDALEPHKNLEYLKIAKYGGDMLSSWFGTLKNVTELHLWRCEKVEYLEDEIKGDLYFPSLKILGLQYLFNLKGWWRQEVVEETKRPRLPNVSSVNISSCPELKGRMPLFEEVEELTLERVDVELVTELLIGNINPNCSPPTSFSTFRQNNNLKNLVLYMINGLISLPEGWLRHLTHLQKLCIEWCYGLEWVSCRGLAHLTALKELSLNHGEITDNGDEDGMKITEAGMPWIALKGLVSLKLPGRDEHLIEGLQYLTSLERLDIEKWKEEEVGDEEMEASLVELPFKSLRNLHQLAIGFDYIWGEEMEARGTARLPLKVIQYLPSLEELRIKNCKELYLGWKTLLTSMKLNSLTLSHVKKVIDVEDKGVKQQSQLRRLYITDGEREWLDDLPWISLSSSLHTLALASIRGMQQLPDGIQHLISLERLLIDDCEEVKSLPIWIPKLTSLRDLTILVCSAELGRRCQEERGEDWPLICHLPSKHIMAKRNEYLFSSAEKRDDEEEGEGSRKGGWCGLSLSKFSPKFHPSQKRSLHHAESEL